MQGLGKVLLNSGSLPIMENPVEWGNLRPILGTIPEIYFGWQPPTCESELPM